jgi:hypothetical protein
MFQKMRKSGIFRCFAFGLFMFFFITASAQDKSSNAEIFIYKKKELNTGLVFYGNSEREEFRTDLSRSYEEITSGSVAFQFKNNFWNYLDYKQDFLKFNFEVGPFYGFGNWTESSPAGSSNADQTQLGIKANVAVEYSTRFYYNSKNYTLLELGGWANYDFFHQNSKGSSTDSIGVVTDFDDGTNESKFRYGFEAKAGWGWGRLNAMNNYMLAQYIVEKYYAGRVFSEKEILQITSEIAIIKGQRNVATGHDNEIESQIISDFLNEQMLLTMPEDLDVDWGLAEFVPRLNGSRIEGGPFFNYFNREPDFVYGAYIQYENAKYIDRKWNRNLSAGINYSRYKKQDWILGEVNIGWSYYPSLKRQFDFGIKYVPGVELNNFEEIGDFNHGFVPYFAYFSQINSKKRISLAFSYRISQDEKIMLPGPEFSLSFYRSKY